MKELCPEVNLPTRSSGGTGLELMTSHNEVLIPCLGPLAAGSLGPNGYSEQSRSGDLNFSIEPFSLFRPPSPPALPEFPAPLPWIRDTESLSEGPAGPCQERKEIGIVSLTCPGPAWQTSYLCATATGDKRAGSLAVNPVPRIGKRTRADLHT